MGYSMDFGGMDYRTALILVRAVEYFIRHNEPVGSRTLTKITHLGLSSASIRNVMSDLDELGFLFQPHTSAGRVPTDMGYRFFVDNIDRREFQPIGTEPMLLDHEKIRADFSREKELGINRLAKSASGALAEFSGQTGFALVSILRAAILARLELVPVAENKTLAVFYTSAGLVISKVIKWQEQVDRDLMRRVSNLFNRDYAGKRLLEIRLLLNSRADSGGSENVELVSAAAIVNESIIDEANRSELDAVMVDGTTRQLDQPEFRDGFNRVKALIETVEEKTRLLRIIDDCSNTHGLLVSIGSEIGSAPMAEFSIIARNYYQDQNLIGTLGVIGPKRMDYKYLMSVVQCTSSVMTDTISGEN